MGIGSKLIIFSLSNKYIKNLRQFKSSEENIQSSKSLTARINIFGVILLLKAQICKVCTIRSPAFVIHLPLHGAVGLNQSY